MLFQGKLFHVDLFFESGSGPAPWVSYFFLGGPPPGYGGRPSLVGKGALFEDSPAKENIYAGRFYGWKADIIAPFRRTELGFDVTDEVLDVVVRPDRTYALKDADQMEDLVAMGIYTPAEADRLHARAREVMLVERRLPPFDDTWTAWQPPPDLGIPEAPPGWQHLPLADSEWGAIHRRVGPT